MHPLIRRVFSSFVFAVICASPVLVAQTEPAVFHGYQQAPQPIHDILSAAPTPLVLVSPKSDYLLVADRLQYPPIADLAQPMLRLAGLRINPVTNGRHHPPRIVGLSLVDIATGKTRKITGLPANAYLSAPEWSPDATQFAFMNATSNGTELWIGSVASGIASRYEGIKINAVMGEAVQWMPDGHSLLVQTIPRGRGTPPAEAKVPEGPIIQESDGKKAPVRTYEDLLEDAHDEALFDYYATAQLVLVRVHAGKLGPFKASMTTESNVGKPAIFAQVQPSPDGQHFLVSRIHRPYSYIMPESDFPREVDVWDRSGKLEYKVASQPLADHVPTEGVLTGPRDSEWVATLPATLVWAEALDGGDPKTQAPYRDHLLMLGAPFEGQPVELVKLEQRFTPGGFGGGGGFGGRTGIEWGENGIGLVRDYDRDRRWTRTFLISVNQPGQAPKLIWERSIRERYKDPGTPMLRALPNGKRVMRQQGDAIFLTGAGASQKGEFPFLDRYDLKTGKSERIFQCADKSYESVVALASDDGARFVTRYETPSDPPNYFVRTAGSADRRALTSFPDPAPQLRNITKQLVTYKRADGVQLSFTLYLPANYKQGERLPTIVWAYPLEFNDAATAGQVSGSPYHFTTITGIGNIHLLLLTQGYAILDSATMPVVGDPETMNNTYVEQVVASAKAAIDKATEMGVTDPNRVGVGGHSYGAFMTANLLAHSDLFRAGVARSGAYNRTLTPFGFQSERRTIWEAPEMYIKVSPFMFADKLRHPILLTHGMADDNSGTFPIQSERMYQAIKGNGGIVRYVQLPYEAHGYLARESMEHLLWEMTNWFDKWVKNAPPTADTKTAQGGTSR
ncbi:MAG TPA: prolyl oligopeptidase family serine peptidase [Candidatus Angelobacter sp.]